MFTLSCGRDTEPVRTVVIVPLSTGATKPRKFHGRVRTSPGCQWGSFSKPISSCVLATSTELSRAELLHPKFSQFVTKAGVLSTRHTNVCCGQSPKGKSILLSNLVPKQRDQKSGNLCGGQSMLTTYTKVQHFHWILAQREESKVEGREKAGKSWSEPKARDAVGAHGKLWLCYSSGWVLVALQAWAIWVVNIYFITAHKLLDSRTVFFTEHKNFRQVWNLWLEIKTVTSKTTLEIQESKYQI